MSKEAYHQQVRMAAVQVAGLSDAELRGALAYEVEPFSGIPANEAEVTFKPIDVTDPTIRAFDVTVKRKSTRRSRAVGIDRVLPWAGIAGALVLAAIACDGLIIFNQRTKLRVEISQRSPLQAELNRLEQEARTKETEAAKVRADREAKIVAQTTADFWRKAEAGLLSDIADTFADKVLLTELAMGGERHEHKLRAVASSSQQAAEALRQLASRIEQRGWRLAPGAVATSENGPTTQFAATISRRGQN